MTQAGNLRETFHLIHHGHYPVHIPGKTVKLQGFAQCRQVSQSCQAAQACRSRTLSPRRVRRCRMFRPVATGSMTGKAVCCIVFASKFKVSRWGIVQNSGVYRKKQVLFQICNEIVIKEEIV